MKRNESTESTADDGSRLVTDGAGEPTSEETIGNTGEIRGYLLKGALVLLAILAILATFRFYTSASAAIDRWVAPDYRPVFQAVFNLVVLLAAGIGISVVVRELAGD